MVTNIKTFSSLEKRPNIIPVLIRSGKTGTRDFLKAFNEEKVNKKGLKFICQAVDRVVLIKNDRWEFGMIN